MTPDQANEEGTANEFGAAAETPAKYAEVSGTAQAMMTPAAAAQAAKIAADKAGQEFLKAKAATTSEDAHRAAHAAEEAAATAKEAHKEAKIAAQAQSKDTSKTDVTAAAEAARVAKALAVAARQIADGKRDGQSADETFQKQEDPEKPRGQ
jgi:hypothetical protein